MVEKRNEIGSEFWEVPTCKNENLIFPDNTVWYLSGRSALRAIIKDIKLSNALKCVALPSWCCDSMIEPFIKEGVQVEFYPVYFEEGHLKIDFSHIENCDAILKMDYFGFKRKHDLEFDGIVIEDVTHSVFNGDFPSADYTFGSLRKWAGFYTGGFAFKNNGYLECDLKKPNNEYIELRKNAMQNKREYIEGRIEQKDFLNQFIKAEEMLDSVGIEGASETDIINAKFADVSLIKTKRRKNAEILLGELSELSLFKALEEDDCPLFVPILVPNGKRDKLRKHLIEKQIYCPTHWPLTEFHKIDDKSKEIYQDEISIVCDQRYNTEDMKRICFEIKSFLNLR